MLIGNVLSVVILQWVVMPSLTSALGPWLRANAPDQRALSIGGAAGIVLLLGGLLLLFRLLAG